LNALFSSFRSFYRKQPSADWTGDAPQDRVRLLEGKKGGYVEMEGSPDMVLETVSDSSVHKRHAATAPGLWTAGIREDWLVDARLKRIVLPFIPWA
jgi:hypothetical protein